MANEKARLKDKKIVIYKQTKAGGWNDKAEFMPIYDPAEIPKLWAYFKQLSGDIFYASATTNTKEECFFRIAWTDRLNKQRPQDYYLDYNGTLYQLTRIDPYEGYKRDLALYCKLATTTLSAVTIVDFDPEKL